MKGYLLGYLLGKGKILKVESDLSRKRVAMGSPICEGARLGTIVTKHPLGVRKFPLG
jgi:hypothetical protein